MFQIVLNSLPKEILQFFNVAKLAGSQFFQLSGIFLNPALILMVWVHNEESKEKIAIKEYSKSLNDELKYYKKLKEEIEGIFLK